MNAYMLDAKGKNSLFELKEKEQFKIVSPNTIKIGNVNYAKVNYKNKEGLIPLNRIRKPTNTDVLKEEAIALENLDKLIKNITSKVGPFELSIKNDPRRTIYKDIIGTRNVTEKVLGREAKSDFNIVSKKDDVIFISHKKAGGAEAFQQYGGISAQAGRKIQKHPEVIEFLRKATNFIEDNKLAHPIYSPVLDPKLINMAIYGHDFGSNFGIDNVTIIGQGSAIIKALPNFENRFELDFSSHLVHNGNSKEFMSGSYKAVLGATYRSGRGFDVDGKRYSGARIGIYPAKLIVNRNSAKEI